MQTQYLKISKLFILFFLVSHSLTTNAQIISELFSPNGSVGFTLSKGANETLSYSVSYNKKNVLNSSQLGIELNKNNLCQSAKFIKASEINKINETYKLISGKKINTTNNCNEQVFKFQAKNGVRFSVVSRVFDDGVAFKYEIEGKDNNLHAINSETTEFSIPTQNGKAWIQPYMWSEKYKRTCYEEYATNGVAINTKDTARGWSFPMLFESNKLWVFISESNLDGNYPACHIDNNGTAGCYRIRFPEKDEAVYPDEPSGAVSTLPLSTPWRCIVVADNLNTIFATQMIQHLNPPSVLKDISWIKPGRSSWSWWSEKKVKSHNRQLAYVDLSAEMKWEYVLIDAGWPTMKDGGTMEDVVKYAQNKNIGVWLWYPSCTGNENSENAKGCIMNNTELRRTELKRISSIGVRGIKVDFFDTDKQKAIKLYLEILKDAADNKLMVDFHGSTLPRGWERTYPNLMAMEAVKGAEGMGQQDRCDRAPIHHINLALTRNIVGSMDYTPVIFTQKNLNSDTGIPKTSWGHQLALAIVFESGFQCFADRESSYKSLPEIPKQFLKQVPVTWDESRLLAGYPDNFVVVARRSGKEWYIGGISGKNEKREISFTLPKECINKEFTLITDGDNITSFKYQKVKSKDGVVKISLLENGGFSGFIPQE